MTTTALTSYQFDDTPVRVVMVAGDPWFVANDISTALGYRNSPDMVRNLDEDEKGTHIMRTLGGAQDMNIISESGLYAAILKSRREEAKRFRKWVTSEVLPSLRRTGAYSMPIDPEPAPAIGTDYDPPRLAATVAVVREARRLFGPAAARRVWSELGLPDCIVDSEDGQLGDPFAEPLRGFLDGLAETTVTEAGKGMGLIVPLDWQTRRRIRVLLGMFGWTQRKVRRGPETFNVWQAPALSGREVEA